MSRKNSHKIGEIAEKQFGLCVSNNGSLFRELGGRDYGIDGIIELFDGEEITGKFFLVQIKGSEQDYRPSANREVISCKVRQTTFRYAELSRIPTVLIALNTTDKRFYYGLLNTLEVVDRDVNEPTVHIPIENASGLEDSVFVDWLRTLDL